MQTSSTGQGAGPNGRDPRNAIMVSHNLLAALKTSIEQGSNPTIDKLMASRGILDIVVKNVLDAYSDDNYLYYVGEKDKKQYMWKESEVAKMIQMNEAIRDKGRFVEGCIAWYLFGEGARPWLSPSREIRPRALSDEEKAIIRKVAAEMQPEKSTVSHFIPTTASVDVLK